MGTEVGVTAHAKVQRYKEVTASLWLKHKVPHEERMAGDEQGKLGGGQPSGLVMGSSAHALEAAMCVSCGGRGEVVHSVGGPAGWLWASHLSSA